MDSLIQDFERTFRSLLRAPGFSLVVLLTLALGIGANTAIFAIVNGVLLKPLAYPRPEELVLVTSQFPQMGFDQFWVSPPEYLELQERSRSFQALGAYSTGESNLGTRERPRRARIARVTAEFFDALGVAPMLGRTIRPEETLPGAAPVAVLTHGLFRSVFSEDPALVGGTIELDGRRVTVAGVMPEGFGLAMDPVDAFVPVAIDPANRSNRGNHYLYLVGRLAPGTGLERARAELETLLADWVDEDQHTPSPTNHRLRYDPLQEQVVGDARTAIWALQAAVGFVLLIACANLANLLLARAESRRRELAIRSALGAGGGRLVRQFLAEGLVLSLLGGLAGVVLAGAGLRALVAAFPDALPRAAEIEIDGTTLAFMVVVALATAIVFGLAQMLHMRGSSLSATLREAGQRSATSGRRLLRRFLVASEVALAVVLVTGAGLMVRTVWNLTQVDPGFDRSGLATFALDLPATTYPDPPSVYAFYARLLEDLRALPGVREAAVVRGLPPLRDVDANDTDIEDYQQSGGEGPFENVDYYQSASTGYLETMGIPIVEGRSFQASDEGGGLVALVNETMAKTFWPGTSPIGRRLKPGFGDELPWITVVGVVKDVKQKGVDNETGTELYFHLEQVANTMNFALRNLNVVVRTDVPLPALAGAIQRIVGEKDPALPVIQLRTMDEVFSRAIGRPRLLARLLLGFAVLALLMAAIGTYGVLAYLVAERRREIGIRMALGAARGSVLSMVLRQGLTLTLVGLAAGLGGALAVNRLAAGLFFGVGPTDLSTYAAVALFICLVGFLACYAPARRATRVDPIVVLRQE
jgi:putative ABC transport system permease protein